MCIQCHSRVNAHANLTRGDHHLSCRQPVRLQQRSKGYHEESRLHRRRQNLQHAGALHAKQDRCERHVDIVHGFNILRLELLNAICFADESRMADCLPECTTLQRTEIVQVALIVAFAFISRAYTVAFDHILIFTELTQLNSF